MEKRCISFPPVTAPGCRLLVLGSMPGVKSLEEQQYYAHPRNVFWPILYALWDAGGPDADYAARLRFATTHRIAIWDVARTCTRRASSDASIRDAAANDFTTFFGENPSIHTVFYNGRLAQSLFEKLAPDTAGGRPCVPLPSTSPAYTLPFAQKLTAWRAVREAAEQEVNGL